MALKRIFRDLNGVTVVKKGLQCRVLEIPRMKQTVLTKYGASEFATG